MISRSMLRLAVGVTFGLTVGMGSNTLAQSSAGQVSAPAVRGSGTSRLADRGPLPLAPLRTLTLTVDEGTWISVDVSPDGHLLAFDLLGQIFTLPISGGQAHQLTTGPAYAERPRFSRDGRWLFFSSDQSGAVALWRVPVRGDAVATPVPPADTAGVPVARWFFPKTTTMNDALRAPGGRYHVRFITGDSPMLHCRYVEVTDSMIQRPTYVGRSPICATGDRGHQQIRPATAFTPDGQAFVAWVGGKLRRIELATGSETIIPFTATATLKIRPLVRFSHRVADDSLVRARRLEYPRVSPDGRRVAFGAFGRLWLQRLPRGTPRRLTDFTVGEYEPVWSPDGRYVAFATWADSSRNRAARGAIYRVRVDGPGVSSTPERLTTVEGMYRDLTYTADGRLAAVHDSTLVWLASTSNSEVASDSGVRGLLAAQPLPGGRPSLSPFCEPEDINRLTMAPRQPGAVRLTRYGSVKDPTTITLMPFLSRPSVAQQAGSALPPAPVLRVRLPDCAMILLSPTGDRALVRLGLDLYLVKVPTTAGPGDSVPILVVDTSVTSMRRLTALGYGAEFPAWAPDGRSFTYSDGATLYRYDVMRAETLVRDSMARIGTTRPIREPAYRPTAMPIAVTLPRDRPQGTVVFRNARLITMRGDTVIEQGDLMVRDRRIAALGPAGTVPIPADAQVIDATGRTILPGLVDLHNHSFSAPSYDRRRLIPWSRVAPYEANLAYGVLTSRDPSTMDLNFLTTEDQVTAGLLRGARFRAVSYAVGSSQLPRPIASLADARTLVRWMAEVYGVKYLKERRLERRDARQWLVMAAAERGLNVVSHGISYAHLVQSALDGYAGYDHRSYSWPLYADVQQLLVRTGITLAQHDQGNGFPEPPVRYSIATLDSMGRAALSRGLPPTAGMNWRRQARTGNATTDTALRSPTEWPWAADSALVQLAAAGGRIGVGAHGETPGYGTHMYLWTLAASGMPALEALRSATLRGAEVLGLEHDLGSLTVGKLADLLVLERNPLERIQHTIDLRYVMFNGRLYDPATLDELWPDPVTKSP